MGYSATVQQDLQGGTWVVSVRMSLSRAESNDLFLSGDSMVAWPVEGLESIEEPALQRSTMFVSEVAARPQGLVIRYRQQEQAERAATILRIQFEQIGIQKED